MRIIKIIFSWMISVIQVIWGVFVGGGVVDDGLITVDFDSLNGTPVYSVTAEENSLLEEPGSPENRGLIFDGWYFEGEKWSFDEDTVKGDMTLTAKWRFSETFFDEVSDADKKADGANIRVMSFNILASDWNNKPPVKGRDRLLVDVVTRYMPDVIGMQEVNAEWYETLGESFGPYRFVNESNNLINGKVNYSTIAYNTETVELISYNQKAFVVNENKNCRNLMWAVFESKTDSSQRFIVTSTHWELTSERRVAEAVEMSGLLRILQGIYKLPMFCTGDYNSREPSNEYKVFTECSLFKSAKHCAEKKGLVCATSHLGDGTGSADDYSSGYWALGTASFREKEIRTAHSIDHIFVSPEAQVLYYDTVVDAKALEASDHCPIYIDVAL